MLSIDSRGAPMFPDRRGVYLELILASHEIEAAARLMRRVWWP
jgi:hypothetical protein